MKIWIQEDKMKENQRLFDEMKQQNDILVDKLSLIIKENEESKKLQNSFSETDAASEIDELELWQRFEILVF